VAIITIINVVFLVILIIEMFVIIMVVVMVDNEKIIIIDGIMNLIDHIIHMLVVNQAMLLVPIGIHHYQQMLISKGKDFIKNTIEKKNMKFF
jgi:hypothetical protein